jgi:hypothetical protein
VKPWLRSAGAASALALAAGAGLVSYERTRSELLALEVCEAVARGDVAGALAASTGATPIDAAGRAISACRCRAEIASGRGEACDALLAGWLAQPMNASELPPPDLAARWIASRRAAGHTREAAEFARRAGSVYPGDAEVFAQELATRASVEDEASVLRELAARIPAEGEPAARMRTALAQRHLRSGDGAAAREVLGETPPPGAGDALGPWFDSRAVAAAFSDDLAGVRRTFEAWRAAGGDPVELRARYALTLSIAGLTDPERAPAALLRASLAETNGRASEGLRQALAIRLVLTLANAGEQDEALALYDAEQALLAPTGVSRAEIARAARMQDLAGATAAQRAGTLAFRVAGAGPDDVLWISPEADAEPDAPYQSIAVPADGRIEIARAEGVSPQRYVLRGAAGGVRASGTVSPVAGTRAQVDVVAREAAKAAEPRRRTRAPGDGRRRVALVLFDCADWRITSYLRTRGELPQLAALLRDGYRAVLDSDPPLTAAAIESLVWPERESGVSLAGLVHRMGVELAGLESIGRNPFEALGWVMPESTDLFATLGAGELRAANLLFAHGSIRAGRNGEVTGPRGARTLLPLGRVERDLESQERLRFPELAALRDERDAHLVHAIAAEMDVATRLASQRDLAFFALRVEPLDILTHAHFAEAVADGQDDGAGLLFSVYRYLDHRLTEVDAALDADDVLIAMSDHGIRTAMEHSRDAIFVAAGGGVPAGRAPGRPALRGVARASADWLGVATQWPQTGVAPVASGGAALAASEHSSDSPARR